MTLAVTSLVLLPQKLAVLEVGIMIMACNLVAQCTGTIFVLKLIFPWSHFGISFPFRRGLFQSYLYKIVVQASPGALEFILKSVDGAKFRWFVLTDMFQSYVIKFRILYQIEFGYGFWNRFSKWVDFDLKNQYSISSVLEVLRVKNNDWRRQLLQINNRAHIFLSSFD